MKRITIKNIAISSILAVSTGLAMVGQASAAGHNTTPHHKGSMSIDKGSFSQLNLTAKQQAQIKTIQKANQNQGKNGHVKTRAAVSKVLTVSQRNNLKNRMAEHRAERGQQDRNRKGHN